MATYGALVSLTNLIDQVQLYHARKPTFTTEQLLQIQSLQEKAYFLQDFLENGNPPGVLTQQEQEDLERRIADVLYRAEDIIESHIVDGIEARFLMKRIFNQISHLFKNIIESHVVSRTGVGSSTKKSNNHQMSHLLEVIRFMTSITEEVTMIKKKGTPLLDQQRQDLVPLGLVTSTTMERDTTVVFDDTLTEFMAKLIGQGSCLQVVPITGMGGIGKTTLAKHAYDSTYVTQYFDIRGWITLSQAYDTRELLLGLALGIGVKIDKNEKKNIECHQLVERLYKHLSGRRYLIIIDDMWDIDAWDQLKASFPKNDSGSRIVVTSRLSNVANYFGSLNIYQMDLLNDDKGWKLLCRKVFVRECCPIELEEIGKKIAKSCKGLPLSIVVIGGLLAKSKMTKEYWEYVANNINTTINLEDGDRCFRILSLSYSHLPVHLKPCFLYMGTFPEDDEIPVSELIGLWIAEGFLKPHIAKSLEEVAEDYLKDLIGRNLIFVKLGITGNLKDCSIHDLLRDFCLREARREKFFCVINSMGHSCDSQGLERRIAILPIAVYKKKLPKISCASLPRTVLSFTTPRICRANRFYLNTLRSLVSFFTPNLMPSIDSKLLRLCHADTVSLNRVTSLMNSRYLNIYELRIPDRIDCLWNLQTLVIGNYKTRVAPSEIWEMPQLRHLMIVFLSLPDPPSGRSKGHGDFVLRNLQTLSAVINFRCTEEVLRRIPNIKKLKVLYNGEHDKGLSHYCIKNLEHLNKLQSLWWFIGDWATRSDLLQNLKFSTSLKKLTLWSCGLDWEDIATKIGPLPNLEKLRLIKCFNGEEWSPVEGQFLRLKFLELGTCPLKRWTAEGTHFPCLERLVLKWMTKLEEIPLGFADIATLQSIEVKNCSKPIVDSAKAIQEEQKNLGNEDFRLTVEGGEEENQGRIEEAGEGGFLACLGFIRKWIQ